MRHIILYCFLAVLASCTKTAKTVQKENSETKAPISIPVFSADSAYQFVKKQVDFGPRVPNSKSHIDCGNYLEQQLIKYGAKMYIQHADLVAPGGIILKSKNIIGSFNPDASTRILLFAHWDTRPWADNDMNPKNHKVPVLGANDGASGIGILLEIARIMQIQKPAVGVDIIFFDAEDYGKEEAGEDSWCLGTQYWAKSKHIPDYRAKYGILLDMVGAQNAKFYREQYSDYYAKYVVDEVWQQAASLGFGNYFINETGGGITDDHLYVNKLAGIPSIDIIQYDPHSASGFADYWHTIDDTMKNIDKNTLQVVGITLLNMIYNEQP